MQLTKEMGGELKHTFRKAGLSNEQFSQGGLSYSSMFRSIDSANDLRALFIKPMACCYLSLHHAGRALYELALTLLRAPTVLPGPTEACRPRNTSSPIVAPPPSVA